MASDVKQCNLNSSGDSSRCNSHRLSMDKSDLIPTNYNKTDGSGENNSNLRNSKEPKAVPKRRIINPAIYVETLTDNKSLNSYSGSTDDEQITPHPHTPYSASSTNISESSTSSDSTSHTRKSCKLPPDSDHSESDDESPYYSKNITQRTYTGAGALPNTFRLSVASLTTTSSVKEERERDELTKKNAFRQWLARKQEEKRERAKQETQEPTQNDPHLTEEQREENFRCWVEHKRRLSAREKAEDLMRQARLRQMIEEEQRRKERENKQKLKQWSKKKEAMKNERARRLDEAAARAAAEEEQRRAAGERAYRDWLRRSARKPLPVPLNQGELSMRGTVSEMYINPIPWQSTT